MGEIKSLIDSLFVTRNKFAMNHYLVKIKIHLIHMKY